MASDVIDVASTLWHGGLYLRPCRPMPPTFALEEQQKALKEEMLEELKALFVKKPWSFDDGSECFCRLLLRVPAAEGLEEGDVGGAEGVVRGVQRRSLGCRRRQRVLLPLLLRVPAAEGVEGGDVGGALGGVLGGGARVLWAFAECRCCQCDTFLEDVPCMFPAAHGPVGIHHRRRLVHRCLRDGWRQCDRRQLRRLLEPRGRFRHWDRRGGQPSSRICTACASVPA